MSKLNTLIPAMVLALLAGTANAGESLIATHAIRAGSLLVPTDVALKDIDIPGAAQSVDEVIGLETRRNLYAGRPVLLSDLGPPTVVRRNDLVTVSYRIDGLLIRVEGRALERGGIGDTVRVMNQTSRATLLTRITGPQNVMVSK